ncbi:MAG TPA: hypothetical protein VGR87_11040 [Candidatus Limnocylindria bacterium]|nr:hypothetical protein [Candidatus Limnocylindria bacterium]
MSRTTRFAAALALVLALGGVVFTANVVQNQPEHLFPAPLLWIAAWSVAPALGVMGTRFGSRMKSGRFCC